METPSCIDMGLIRFVKMHGAGNDFVVIDNRETRFTLDEIIAFTPRLCDRRTGIGADGLLVLNASKKADFTMIYRNADGSDAGMCGNGGRCIASFAISNGFPPTHRFDCNQKVYEASVHGPFIRLSFPITAHVIEIPDGFRIDTGTDHVVVPVTSTELHNSAALVARGRILRHRHNANVNFVCARANEPSVDISTYERGVEDLTLACGTGALAAATWWHHAHGEKATTLREFPVVSKGGTLLVDLNVGDMTASYHHFHLTGPTVRVFEGIFHL